tara:strand:+ start:1191 stop:1451 length:261 start_codon:yes stop_codon:yes gene_type:complete
MPDITVSLTDTEQKCLDTITMDVPEFVSIFAKNRARQEKDTIITNLVKYCNENSISIATGVDAQITQAYAVGVAHTAANYDLPLGE